MFTPSPVSSRRSGLHPGSAQTGFSLVEVVIALGIFTFAIVGVLGLFPLALSTHLNAKISTIQAQIHQRLAAEALLTDYTRLQDLDGRVRYFNEEGVEISASAKEDELKTSVFTSMTVVTSASLPSAGATYAPGSMRKVVFYAIHDPGLRGISESTKPSGAILIANTAASPGL